MRVAVPHADAAERLAPLPAGIELAVWRGPEDPDPPADTEILVAPFGGPDDVVALAGRLPALRVVQALNAGVDRLAGRFPAGVTLCDARGVHDVSTAEWVVAAVLAAVREVPGFVRSQGAGRWEPVRTEVLAGKTVLLVGYGSIGSAVERRLAGFEVEMIRVARRPRPGVAGTQQLPDLLGRADVVVVLTPLTDQTRGLVDADFLARMHDGALLVNAARGPVVDTAALLAELERGRLRAALDVTEPEPLPPGHPLWSAPGVYLSPHVAGFVTGLLPRAYALVRAQLRRAAAGEPLENVVADGY